MRCGPKCAVPPKLRGKDGKRVSDARVRNLRAGRTVTFVSLHPSSGSKEGYADYAQINKTQGVTPGLPLVIPTCGYRASRQHRGDSPPAERRPISKVGGCGAPAWAGLFPPLGDGSGAGWLVFCLAAGVRPAWDTRKID